MYEHELGEDGINVSKKSLPLPTVEPSPDFLAEMAAIARDNQPLHDGKAGAAVKPKRNWNTKGFRILGVAASVVVIGGMVASLPGDTVFGKGGTFSGVAKDASGEVEGTEDSNSYSSDSGYKSRYDCGPDGNTPCSGAPSEPPAAPLISQAQRVEMCVSDFSSLSSYLVCIVPEEIPESGQ